MQRRTMLKLAAALGAAVCVAGAQAQAQTQTIKVGVTGGPHAQVMEEVKKVAAKHGLDIRIVEFSDYVQPNAALAAGDLDANSYQHAPYLDAQVKDRGYRIVKVADTVTFPMGVYSKRVNSLAALRAGRGLQSRTIRRTAAARCCCCRSRGSSSCATGRA